MKDSTIDVRWNLVCWFYKTRRYKKRNKKRGHRAWFQCATMLTKTVIKVTFGDLRAQQISAIIFQCDVSYHTEFDFLWLFIHLPPGKNGFKYLTLLINIFILWWKHNSDLLCWARYVSICSIYFICQKSSHRFLPMLFSVIEDIVFIEFIK